MSQATVTVTVRELIDRFQQEAKRLYEQDWPTLAVPPAANDLAFDSEHLFYVNDHWQLRPSPDVPTTGIAGLARRLLRPIVARIIWFGVRPYLDEEMRFRASMVNLMNEVAARGDASVEAQRLIVEASSQLVETARAVSIDLAERDELLHALLEARIERVETALAAPR